MVNHSAPAFDHHPGKSVRALEDLPTETRHNVSRSRLRRAVDRLAGLGYVVNKGTDARPEWYARQPAVVAYDVLSHSIGQRWGFVTPIDAARRAREGKMPPPPPEWETRRIGR